VAQETPPQQGRVSVRCRTGFIPLTELGKEKYKGQDGGLYGNGRNDPPAQHLAAAMKRIAEIQPLNAAGEKAEDGKVVLMSVGMSNTAQHFRALMKLARQDKRLLQAIAGPKDPFPTSARDLQKYISAMLRTMHRRYPNLKVVYLSSRAYAGYATKRLNPEPFAYESAFAVRWVIQDQIAGEPALNFDPSKGQVKAPLLLWGPYLWADGIAGRGCDDLVWEKSAKVMLEFFKTDPTTKPWFLAPLP